MNKRHPQEWNSRREIPDSQIKDAADQYEAARQFLSALRPGSGVLLPLMNASTVAIELYLKCMSSEQVHVPMSDGSEGCMVHSDPARGHVLVDLIDKIPEDVRRDLAQTFGRDHPEASKGLRGMLASIEGAFIATRYPFEAGTNISDIGFRELMLLSRFLHKYVAGLDPKETIQWQ